MKKIFIIMMLLMFGAIGLSCKSEKKPEYEHINAKAIQNDDPRVSTTNISLSLIGCGIADSEEDAKKYAITELKSVLWSRIKPTSFALKIELSKKHNGRQTSWHSKGSKANEALLTKIKTTTFKTNNEWVSYARFDGEAEISIPNSPNVITETMVGKFAKRYHNREMHVGIRQGITKLFYTAVENAKERKFGNKDGTYYGIGFLTDLSVEEVEGKFMLKCKFAIIFDEE